MTGIPEESTVLTDVNVIAIGLTENHPAYEYVWPRLRDTLDGPNTLLVFDHYPLRAQHIMTNQFDVPRVDARNAVQSLVRSPARIVGADESVILDAYELSAEKHHDVYDTFLLALARARDADLLLTTDEDFETLCADESVVYRNPIPDEDLDVLAFEG